MAERENQKVRTRKAIIDACRELARTGAEMSMPRVAKQAMVSEATAYRYFPTWSRCSRRRWRDCGRLRTGPRPGRPLRDPAERVAFACSTCCAACTPTRARCAR